MVNPKSKIPNPKNKIIFIVGPTATGKSETAACLAEKLNAEIVSCDSMQIYKGMDIITSMPAPSLRERIPHHLINIVPVSREFNVSKYRSLAIKKVKEIFKRGKIPLFVGGTGHYMSILVDGIFKAKAQSFRIRNKLYKLAENKGSTFLYDKLSKVDPEAAEKIHPNDTKRIIRALEVFQITGKRISELQKQRRGLWQDYEIKIFCLNPPRDKLYQKIDARVDWMFKQGLLAQVKELLQSKLSKTAFYAIGIKELKGYLEGVYDLAEAKRLIQRNTRLYAKRQLTWFRNDKRIEWVGIADKEKPASVAKRIFGKL